ncbi:MAG TPA: hypothetical protein VMB51_14545 [Solirubrobacteraceae bacterium]|nr:hypothetical protein [Solirubrobacteraceae bacterium]
MSKSKTALGLAVAVCAFGVVAAPALAFGKFYASTTGTTKGAGEAETLKVGPYKITCENPIKAKGQVTSTEPAESFYTEVKFRGCETVVKPAGGSGIEEIKKIGLNLGMEFLSNYSAKVGEGESEAVIKPGSEVSVKAHGGKCTVVIPEQRLPLKQKEGVEYEAAVPETVDIAGPFEEGTRQFEKYGEFRTGLSFEINLKKIRSYITPNDKCRYKEESEEGKYNPETGNVEFNGGLFVGDLEEIALQGGNLSFE